MFNSNDEQQPDIQSLFGMQEHPATPALLSMGAKALASGKVSEGEVVAAKQVMQTPQGAKAIANLINPKKSSKKDTKESTDTKHSTTHSLYLSPEEIQSQVQGFDSIPGISDQRQGIKDMEDMLSMQAQNQPQDNNYIAQNLAMLADAQSGSHMAQELPKYESQDERNKQISASMNELQKRKSDLSKMVFEGIQKTKSGSETNAQNQSLQNTLSEMKGMMGGAGGLANTRAAALAARAGTHGDNDKTLLALENSFNNFDKFQGMMDDPKTPVTEAIFNNMQEELTRAAKAGGGAGGTADAAVVRDQMKTLAGSLNALQSKIGKIKDMRVQAPQLFTQLQNFKNQLRSDFENAYGQRIDQLKNAYDIPANMLGVPEIAEGVHKKMDALKAARITGGKPLSKKSDGPAVGSVKNGYRFKGGDPADQTSWEKM